ncbi:unnamed protein product [Symbiodinium sp. CCMP2456]|nr:unnamed protein product [Symbiodinium sp. CCMP2456]
MVLHDYYHCPVDSFIIRASSVFCFDEDVPVYTKIDGRARESVINGSDGIFFPCGVNVERMRSVTGIEMKIRDPFHQGQRRCELQEIMQRWGISREGLGKLGAHLVPEPVCKLLLRGKWQDLLFMSRWFKGPFARRGSWAEQAGFRLPDALWAVAGEHETLQGLEPLELQHLQQMLDHIRRWSPAILAQCETEDAAAGEQLLLESFATWLRQLLTYFAPHFAENAADLRTHLGERDAHHGLQRYSDRQLVGMVLFAWHLRDSVGFKEVAPSALEAMFPKFFSLTGLATGKGILKQSKTLLRSAQLSVDVALMLLRRKGFEERPNTVRYGWADSSPIAQADWIICKHQAIASQSCLELFQACAELRSIEVDVLEEEERERRVELCQQLLAEIRVHTQPPQAMALGLTAIESKLSALAFSFYLEDISKKLSHWPTFVNELSSLEALLCNRDRRERFVTACIPKGADERNLFSSFSGSLYEKRWGAVISFLGKLMPLLGALTQYWDAQKFVAGYQQRESADDEQAGQGAASFVPAALSKALESSLFHVYASMILSVLNIVDGLTAWFEGCACHEVFSDPHSKKKLSRLAEQEFRACGTQRTCPMKGKRAPELAAGCLDEVFLDLLNISRDSVLKCMRMHQLSSEEESVLWQDFESSRSFLQMGLQIKFDFWGKVPWKLAALSHPDQDVARQAAGEMLQLSDGLDAAADSALLHHPVTVDFLGAASQLRPLVQAFADGGHMAATLHKEASKLAFIPVVERSIEAKHSLISRRVQKNWRSGRIVSLTLRVPDIKAEVAADAEFLNRLTEAFGLVRDPRKAAHQLGIQDHPSLLDASFAKMHRNKIVGLVNKIVYRSDLESKFEKHRSARVEHEAQAKKRARLAERQIRDIAAQGVQPQQQRRQVDNSFDSVLRVAIADHFQVVSEATPSACVYSLKMVPSEQGSLPVFRGLESVLSRNVKDRFQLPAPSPTLRSDVDDETEINQSEMTDDVVHFQVLHGNPSRLRTVPLAPAAGERLQKGDIAVSVHLPLPCPDGAWKELLDRDLVTVRQGLPLTDSSSYELMKQLELDGWAWSVLPQGPELRRQLCYRAGDTKTWYCPAGALPHKLYLVALLECARLELEMVPHWAAAPARYYSRLLDGKSVPAALRQPVRALLNVDVDDAEVRLHEGALPASEGAPRPMSEHELAAETLSEHGSQDSLVAELEALIEQVPDSNNEARASSSAADSAFEGLPPDPESRPVVPVLADPSNLPVDVPVPPAGPPVRVRGKTTADALPGQVEHWGVFRISPVGPVVPDDEMDAQASASAAVSEPIAPKAKAKAKSKPGAKQAPKAKAAAARAVDDVPDAEPARWHPWLQGSGPEDVEFQRAGPRTFEDVMLWARNFLPGMLAAMSAQGARVPRVLDKLQRTKLVLTSSYSGMGVAEMSVPFLQDAFQERGVKLSVRYHASRDHDELCRKMLLHAEFGSSQESHVFGDIFDFVTTTCSTELLDLQQECHQRLARALSGKTGPQKRSLSVQHGRNFAVKALGVLGSASPPYQQGHCFRHQKVCPFWPPSSSDAWHVEIAGSTCTPWSSSGKHLGWLDKESVPCLVWMHAVAGVRPAIVIHECTPTFDVEVMLRFFQDDYVGSSLVFGPLDLGIPCNRLRRYTVLLRKDLCASPSPRVLLFSEETFLQLVGARVASCAAMFLRATAEEVRELVQHMADQRHVVLPHDTSESAINASALLSPWHRQNLQKYKSALAGNAELEGAAEIIVDLSQDADERPRMSCMMPCLLRTSLLYALKARRPLTPSEWFCVQCLPMSLPADNDFASFVPWLPHMLRSLSRNQAQQLAGNSMVLPAMGSVLLAAVLSCLLLGTNTSMKRGLSEFELDVDAEGDGGEEANQLDEDGVLVPAPPKPAKGDRQARHKSRKTGKGMRLCRACGCTKPEGEFAVNQNMDMSCKKALDNISRMAKQQGPHAMQFVAEAKADPTKLRKMLDSYGKAHKMWTSGKTPKIQWSVVTYMETVLTETGVQYSGNSKMMWEKQAVLFWMSIEGGCMSEEDAEAKWKSLAGRLDDEDVVHDMKGPAKKPLRLAVKFEDIVSDFNKVAKQRRVDFQEKQQKKPDEATIEKYMRRATSSHEEIGGSAAASIAQVLPSGDRLSQTLVRGGPGSAFDNMSMQIGDIRNLLPDVSDQDDAKAKAKDDAAESEVDKESENEAEQQKERWFDKDRSINKAQRALQSQEDKLLQMHQQRTKELQSWLGYIGGLTPEDKAQYQGEEKIGKVRLQFMEGISKDETGLQDLIQQFKNNASPMKPKASGAADAASSAAGVARLGNSPPCKQFASLVTLANLTILKDEVVNCESAQDIAEHKKKYCEQKAPIMDLLASVQAVINDMKKVKKMLDTQAQKIAAAKAKPAAKGTAPVYSIFQLSELCEALPPKGGDGDGASKFQANEPGIMNVGEGAAGTLFGVEVKLALSQLSKLMKEASAAKAGSHTRAEVNLDEAAMKAIADPLKKLLPDNMRVHTGGTDGIQTGSDELTQLLHKHMLCTGFGIVKMHATFGHERSFFPCVRVSFSGTREIVLMPYLPLAKHVQNNSAAGDSSAVNDLFDPKVKTACIQFLKFCNKEKFQSYLSSEGARAFHGTIGPSDMLFVPPGYIFAELTKEFVLGMKCPIFVINGGDDSTQKILDQLKSCSVKDLNKSADAYAQAVKSQAR